MAASKNTSAQEISASYRIAEPHFFSTRVDVSGLISACMIIGLCTSWLGLLGRWYWVLDLFSHFRWQHLLISLVAVVWAGWSRTRATFAMAVATLLLNAGLIGQLALTQDLKKATLASDFHLRVVSLNVLTSNTNHDGVLRYLRTVDADVIMLMEVDDHWAQSLQPLAQSHPHHIVEARYDNFGIALFSRLPLDGLEIVDISTSEVPSVEARLKIAGRELSIIGTHTLPPTASSFSASRDDQLATIALRVRRSSRPTVLVGDFNATPWSHGLRLVQADGILGYRSLQPAWTPTWYGSPLLAIPIDHVLCSAPLIVVKRSVGPDVGSDHRALLVDLGWAL
jgi:endonuclease/exonuclease/phosphatase (EEP) superfamily protein YafD